MKKKARKPEPKKSANGKTSPLREKRRDAKKQFFSRSGKPISEARARSSANLKMISSPEMARQYQARSIEAHRDRAVFRDEIMRQLAGLAERDRKKRSVKEKLVYVLLRAALKGDVYASRTVIERVDGRVSELEEMLPPQRIVVIVNRNIDRHATTIEALKPAPEEASEGSKIN